MLNYQMKSTEIKCEFLLIVVVLKEVSDNITFTPKVEHGLSIKDSYTILILRIIIFF